MIQLVEGPGSEVAGTPRLLAALSRNLGKAPASTPPKPERPDPVDRVLKPPQPPHFGPECIRMDSMQQFDRITWNPNQMNGQACVRGMRLTVRRVVEAVALYPNRDDLYRNYPELEPEDVRQALAFAAANLEDSASESNAA